MFAIFSATIVAVLPLIPVSISSKIKVSISSSEARIDFMASIIRESSPPDATLFNGLTGSPGFVEIIKLTLSNPLSVIVLLLSILISKLTAMKFKSIKDLVTCSCKTKAAFFLSSDMSNEIFSISKYMESISLLILFISSS